MKRDVVPGGMFALASVRYSDIAELNSLKDPE